MSQTNISDENRKEFDLLGVHDVRRRVEHSIWAEPKLREARAWLDENNPAWISAMEAQKAGRRAWIAIGISFVALLVSAITLAISR